jgi:hypothetical protein
MVAANLGARFPVISRLAVVGAWLTWLIPSMTRPSAETVRRA